MTPNSDSPNPFARVRPGDKLGGKITAEAWNAMADAARAELARQASVGAESSRSFRQSGVVKVKNVSGADAPRGGVLKVTDWLIDPAENLDGFREAVTLQGDTPEDGDELLVVMIDATPDQETGRAVISGAAVAAVDVTDDAHEFARGDGSVEEMVSDTEGPIRILAHGEGYAYVLLGAAGAAASSQLTFLGKLDGTLSVGGSQAVSIWAHNGSAFVDTGANVTAHDWLLKSGATAIASGKKVIVQWFADSGLWVVIDWECP